MFRARKAGLAPVVEFLDHEGITSPTATSAKHLIHAHSFSNGGTIQLISLATMLRDRSTSRQNTVSTADHTLPIKTICIDSAPGSNKLVEFLRGFTVGIRSPFLLYTTYFLLLLFAALAKAYEIIWRPGPIFIDKMRNELIDSSLLPKEAKRLYIYSKTDLLIAYQDVESHIEDARRAGFSATKERYEKSSHVAHMRTDGNR